MTCAVSKGGKGASNNLIDPQTVIIRMIIWNLIRTVRTCGKQNISRGIPTRFDQTQVMHSMRTSTALLNPLFNLPRILESRMSTCLRLMNLRPLQRPPAFLFEWNFEGDAYERESRDFRENYVNGMPISSFDAKLLDIGTDVWQHRD